MIIDYDHNPALTVDQKLQSLKESVQMALNEIITEQYNKSEVDKKISDIQDIIDNAILQSTAP